MTDKGDMKQNMGRTRKQVRDTCTLTQTHREGHRGERHKESIHDKWGR